YFHVTGVQTCALPIFAAKVSLQRVNPREVYQLALSLKQAAQVPILLSACKKGEPLDQLSSEIEPMDAIYESIQKTIRPDAPAQTLKGGFIADGVDAELDELRSISHGGKHKLVSIQKK